MAAGDDDTGRKVGICSVGRLSAFRAPKSRSSSVCGTNGFVGFDGRIDWTENRSVGWSKGLGADAPPADSV
ncbi:hypothetical protein GCM10027068_05000 [Prescottella soli]